MTPNEDARESGLRALCRLLALPVNWLGLLRLRIRRLVWLTWSYPPKSENGSIKLCVKIGKGKKFAHMVFHPDANYCLSVPLAAAKQ